MQESAKPFRLLSHEEFKKLTQEQKVTYLALAVEHLAKTQGSRLLAPNEDEPS
jgi:hypothetical protein